MASDERTFTRDRGPDPSSPRHDAAIRPPGRTGLRRLAPHKLVAALALVVLVTFGLISGGRYLVGSGRQWLATQPDFLLGFREIRLEPEPPAWIKSGRRGLLEQVQNEARWPENLAILNVDLETLAADFRRGSPWVRQVIQVARPDRSTLIVKLSYRRPAGYLRLDNGRRIYLDGEAVVLPAGDLDPRGLPRDGQLPQLQCVPSGWTAVPLSGQRLVLEASSETATAGAEAYDPRLGVIEAAALAGFLTEISDVSTRPDGRLPLALTAIQATADGLWVESNGHLIWWTPSARLRRPGQPTDAEKWALLLAWLDSNSIASINPPRYLAFDSKQVVVQVAQ